MAMPTSTISRSSHTSRQPASSSAEGGWAGGRGSATKVPPPRPRVACRWPLWASAVRAWRSVERAMPSRAHSSRSAGRRVPGSSSPSLIAVPSRSTVSSNAVWEWTGANTASSPPADRLVSGVPTWGNVSSDRGPPRGPLTASMVWGAIRGRPLQALEAPYALPVCDRRLEGGELDVGGVDVVIDDLVAERSPGHGAGVKQVPGLAQGAGQPRLVGGLVGVALIGGLECEPLRHAVQPGGDDRAQRHVGVEVRA